MRRQAGTPTRSVFVNASILLAAVRDALSAVKSNHKELIDQGVRATFADSLDLDVALQAEYPNDNRWDYLLGHQPSRSVIGLEPHSAKQHGIATVIAKRRSALTHLHGHLKPGARIAAWLWVASGTVRFADTEKARRRLDQNGIRFVGRRVLEKHLPATAKRAS